MQTPSNEPTLVRKAQAGDLVTLVTFNRQMALETEGKALDLGRLEEGIRAALADPERGRYFLAVRRGEPVGCLMLTREWSDWRAGWFWWIQSVFVEKGQRRSGVFRQLYAGVIEEARRDASVSGIRLYVDRDNRAAQAVYGALGMSQSHYLMYELDFVLDPGSGA